MDEDVLGQLDRLEARLSAAIRESRAEVLERVDKMDKRVNGRIAKLETFQEAELRRQAWAQGAAEERERQGLEARVGPPPVGEPLRSDDGESGVPRVVKTVGYVLTAFTGLLLAVAAVLGAIPGVN